MTGLLVMTMTVSSCYSSTFVVGEGAQTGVVEKGKNNFFIFGLAEGKHVDTQQMAKGKADYKVEVEQSFVDGILGILTFGIYTPRTVHVTH